MVSQVREDLESLAHQAEKLLADLEVCESVIERTRSLTGERDRLTQVLFLVRSGEPLPARKSSKSLERRRVNLNGQIEKAQKPINQFHEVLGEFRSQLRSFLTPLRFSAQGAEVKALGKEIEGLPLVAGIGQDLGGMRNDLFCIQVGLSNLLNLLYPTKRSYSGVQAPLPAGVGWDQVEIRFLTEHSITVTAPGYTGSFQYQEAGFEDKRKGTPNTAWAQLLILAKYGHITRPTANPAKVEKAIEALRKTLRSFLGLKDDPLFPYRQERRYRPRFKLLSERDDAGG